MLRSDCRAALLALMAALLFAPLPDAVGADPGPLLKFVPAGANAILVMDASAVKESALSKGYGWTRKHQAAAAERPLFLPPEATAIVVAAQLDPQNDLTPEWELAVVEMGQPVSMAAIAKAEGGYVEKFNGVEAAWTPSEAYFIQLEPQTMGVMYPANRQAVSRWTAAARKSRGVVASDYLTAASKRLSPKTPIVLALDLKDAVPPHAVHQAVMETNVINAKPEKQEEIARVMSHIEGITLTVELDVPARVEFQFDFSESSAPFANFAKPLLIETLNRVGVSLPELDKFQVTLKDRAAMFRGAVQTTSLRRLFSLLEIPTTKFSSVDEQSLKASGEDAAASASADYFRAVQALIDDLRSTLEDTRDNHAVWMERYARKVDRLPILNVDEELLEWGGTVGESFRAMSVAQRNAGIRSGSRKSAVYGNYWYQYDNNGYYTGARSTESMRSQITAEERAGAKTVRYQRWKELEDATAAIRKTMTRKYQREF